MNDPRNITTGAEIPTEHYSDQPYIVKTDDGAWLCALTTGTGVEGEPGQHVVTLRSTDQGRSWTSPVDVEPANGPESSYAVLLKVPGGRVYCFYNHNSDNLRAVIADDPPFAGGLCKRVDSLGYFVFKYSDDHGCTWSTQRYPIPVRAMDIDQANPYHGRVRFFWNVGKPLVHAGAAYVPLHKVGGFGHGFFTRSEGVLLKSTNLPGEADPLNITWETLPDGDAGLRTPPGGGPIAEEQSYSVLSDGSFYCVYRSIDGHPVCSYSRDGGHTWTTPQYMCYADGRLMKHPRAANFAWKCANGKYLYWFHNHGGRFTRAAYDSGDAGAPYQDRNPVWLCGGIEVDDPAGKIIQWSQPEIVLYDDDPFIRMSYPDLVEDDGCYYLTETQKDVARVHHVNTSLIEGLWQQFDQAAIATDGLLLSQSSGTASLPAEIVLPALPALCASDAGRADYGRQDLRQGFTIELWFSLRAPAAGQVLLDNRTPAGKGWCVQITAHDCLEIVLNDGRTENRWACDPDLLRPDAPHHVVIVVDGGPKIISFIVDGRLCDGGDRRQFGWGRFSPHLRDVNGLPTLRLVSLSSNGKLYALRIYQRALRTSEAVANGRAGYGR
ncbi:MAG: exo-alpha-sialidase [Chloroflexi bacterium]|nr:exo-alpha-sialidase [Chloroflexota bacterium]